MSGMSNIVDAFLSFPWYDGNIENCIENLTVSWEQSCGAFFMQKTHPVLCRMRQKL